MKSMTGYGRARNAVNGREISVEIGSVNHRYLDVNVRCPRAYSFLEDALKQAAGARIARGRVDIFVQISNTSTDDIAIQVNVPLAKHYLSALHELAQATGLSNDISLLSLANMPEVLTEQQMEPDVAQVTMDVISVFEQAADEFSGMRAREGEKLAADVCMHRDLIRSLLEQVEVRAPKRTIEYREKLKKRIYELLSDTTIDEQRVLTEVAIFADRVAIDEETVRLHSHLVQLGQMLSDTKPIGRKLDFLVQEMNREANTIGSKANDMILSKLVVDLKSEIEKIREQVQNIE